MTGVPVEGSVWQRLPKEGTLSFPNGNISDVDGKITIEYLPPSLTKAQIDRDKSCTSQIRFTARAKTEKAGEPEAQLKAKLLGLVELAVMIEHSTYLSPELLPISLASLDGGTLTGRVIFRTDTKQELPVYGATVRLMQGKDVLGGVVSDGEGNFILNYGDPANAIGPAEIPLAEPLVFSAYAEEIDYFVCNTKAALRSMQTTTYGYKVAPLYKLMQAHFAPALSFLTSAHFGCLSIEHLHAITWVQATLRIPASSTMLSTSL